MVGASSKGQRSDVIEKLTIHQGQATLAKMGNNEAAKSSFDPALAENPNKRMKGMIKDAIDEL